ncbi:lytic transglycosylase domain-containing protein [Acidisoma cladoniae]|uniref:lytic transglycosylase domain-containing protein n=1 Tax=Acidisoma cladoniae TaxID=3040935 RepID=UPI003313ECCB
MIPFLSCMALVASIYSLPPRVLPAIQAVEGGHVGDIHNNLDRSQDLGVMQINTLWVHPLALYSHRTDLDVRMRLITDPCFNIAAAGAILSSYLNEESGDLMRAVGDYHSHTPLLNVSYRAEVMRSARKLFAPERSR